jgi:hypothetical protein
LGFFVSCDMYEIMQKILLTLTMLASLTIAAQAQSQTAVTAGAVTGTAETNGVVTVYRGAPAVTVSPGDKFVADSYAAFRGALDDLETAPMSLPPVSVTRKSATSKAYNHDGLAFQGLKAKQSADALAHAQEINNAFTFSESNEGMTESMKPAADYAKNIKSGKWRKFVNGE